MTVEKIPPAPACDCAALSVETAAHEAHCALNADVEYFVLNGWLAESVREGPTPGEPTPLARLEDVFTGLQLLAERNTKPPAYAVINGHGALWTGITTDPERAYLSFEEARTATEGEDFLLCQLVPVKVEDLPQADGGPLVPVCPKCLAPVEIGAYEVGEWSADCTRCSWETSDERAADRG